MALQNLLGDLALDATSQQILTELEKKADVTEVQPVQEQNPIDISGLAKESKQLPNGHEVEVNNLPTEYPLPSSQVSTLTPPPAITGYATSAKQDLLLTELEKKADLTETQPVSAASLPLPSGAATSANQTNGNQQTKITNGATIADTFQADSGNNGVVTGGATLSVPFSTSAAQAVATTDCSFYSSVSVSVSAQGTSSTVTFQYSDDNVTWSPLLLMRYNTTDSQPASSTTAVAVFNGGLPGKYFRLNVTGISAGTTSGMVTFKSAAIPTYFQAVTVPAVSNNIAKAEDSASASGDVAVPALAVRRDLPLEGASVSANGDYVNLTTNSRGDLRVESILADEYGNEIEGTMLNQLKVAQSYRLSGGVFNLTTLDTNFFTAVTSAGGTATVSGGELTLSLTTTSGSYAGIRTNSTARYMGSNMNYYRSVHRVGDLGAANNVRRCGLCDTLPVVDGFFFQLSNTTFQVVSRKAGVDTTISSGSFNGNGTLSSQSYTLDTNYHTFEIYYTNRRVMFVVDGNPIHTFTSTTTTLAGTRHFRAFMDSSNTGVGSAVNCLCSSLTVNRYGSQVSQPKTVFQQGTTAGLLLKVGIGSIHSLIISGVINNSVITLYDNTSATGTIIWSSGAMGAQTIPFDVSFNGSGPTQFENGLYMTITGANSNVFIKYE